MILGAELLLSQGKNSPIQVTILFFNLDNLGQNSVLLCQGGGQAEHVHACFTRAGVNNSREMVSEQVCFFHKIILNQIVSSAGMVSSSAHT